MEKIAMQILVFSNGWARLDLYTFVKSQLWDGSPKSRFL